MADHVGSIPPMQYALILVAVAALLAGGCGGGDDDSSDAASSGTSSVPECHERRGARSRRRRRRAGSIGAARRRQDVQARLRDESCGTFTVTLDPKTAPNASASLVALARNGFFDNTVFHRIVPGFVIPGRRPHPERQRRPRLHDRRQATGELEVHEGRRRDGEVADRARRRRGQPVLHRHVSRHRPPADYAIVGDVTGLPSWS